MGNASKKRKVNEVENESENIPPISQFVQEREENNEKVGKKNKIGIKFISMDQSINCLITCKTSDYFSEIEKKLYKKFPDLNGKNIHYIANGKMIDRTTTIGGNKIKHGEYILIVDTQDNDNNEHTDIQEKRILLHFISTDQNIKFDLNTGYSSSDSFSLFLEKLYTQYPNLRNKNLMFLANGNVIDITANIEKNKIKDDDTIIIVENERIILIHFISTDQRVNIELDVACENSDNFSIVEERLYQEYPELQNKNIVFLMNGNMIDRKETLEKNKIKDDCFIVIAIIDDD